MGHLVNYQLWSWIVEPSKNVIFADNEEMHLVTLGTEFCFWFFRFVCLFAKIWRLDFSECHDATVPSAETETFRPRVSMVRILGPLTAYMFAQWTALHHQI